MLVQFDDWLYDGDQRLLLRANRPVHLSPKAFDMLGLLLARRPAAVSKLAIKDALWPQTFVEDANLPSLIAEVRTALQDDPRQPRYVRTVHRFGYAFCATPAASAPAGRASFQLLGPAGEILLREGETVLGRANDLAGVIESTSVSRQHARVVVASGRVTIEDLDSKNGTFVREQRIRARTALSEGDAVRLGTVDLVFRAVPDETTSIPGADAAAWTAARTRRR